MSEEKKHKLLFVVLAVLLVILSAIIYLIYKQIGQARDIAQSNPDISATATSSTSDNLSVTYNLGSPDTNLSAIDDVKDVANRFMEAKLERDLESAKPYMTDELIKSTTSDAFAGTSSPSMDRFEITNAQAVKTPNTYAVDVTSYWKLNGDDSGNLKYQLTIIKKDNNYLVSQFKEI